LNAQKMVAIVLVVLGGVGLAYGGFSYTSQTHQADIGTLHLSVDETKHVSIPVWAGIAAIVLGGLMLAVARKD
jgi:TRAP-type C4-dicarboxylate transport system permease small subunit